MDEVLVAGSFDDLRSNHVRFLEEASRFGSLHVLLWSDETVRLIDGRSPKFPREERRYVLQAMRYVKRITLVRGAVDLHTLPDLPGLRPTAWAVTEREDHPEKRRFCARAGLVYHVVKSSALAAFPDGPSAIPPAESGRKKVVVTGCYDWFHSGHIRFFEEVSELGALYVVVGHDANIRLLKGDGHPLYPQNERRYMVQAVRHVKQALISSGSGWMDAEPEIAGIRPDIYAVNEDGDKPEKREFCRGANIEYVVLKRLPKPGLTRRQSTDLRGF